MIPQTALPARPGDASVQGAPRTARGSSVREDLARSRDDFARALERESAVPDRSADRAAADRADRAAADRAATDRADRAAADRADRAGTDGAATHRAPVRPVDEPAPTAPAFALGASSAQPAVIDAPAPEAPATPAAATPAATEASPALAAQSLAAQSHAAQSLAAQTLTIAAAAAAAAATTAPVATATVAVTAPGEPAPSALPSDAVQAAAADPSSAGTGASTAPALGATGSELQSGAAPLVVDGSRVVLTGAAGALGTAVAQADAGRPGDQAAPAGTATALAGASPVAGPEASPADASVVRGGEPAPGAPATPSTAPAASFAQALTGATDRIANQAPATPASTPHVPLAEQVRGPLVALRTAAPGEHMLTLRVDPDHLGPVQVRAHIGADGIRIELVGATDAARDSLRGLLTDLRRDLSATGMNATLTLAADTAGQQSRNPGGAADLFGGQQGGRGENGTPGGTQAQRDRGTSAWTAPDQSHDARTAASTLPGALGVDVLV